MAVAVLWFVFLRPVSLGGPATYVIVAGDSMLPDLRTGDLVLAVRAGSYRAGDVAAYRVPPGEIGAGTLIIHRIVDGSAAQGYVLKGDNRQFRDPWSPRDGEIAGKQVLVVPRVGLALAFLRTPLGLASVAGLLAFALVGGTAAPARPRPTVLARASTR